MAVTAEDLARTLIARRESEHQRYRARAAELVPALERWAQTARASGLIAHAWLLGSLAKGTWGADSDVDIAIESLRTDHPAEVWTELMKLTDCSVDLLQIEELPAPFAERIRREGRRLA